MALFLITFVEIQMHRSGSDDLSFDSIATASQSEARELMVLRMVVAASALCQFGAAVLALRLVKITGKVGAWWMIAAATSLMALRRCLTLFHLSTGRAVASLDLTSELAGLATSVLMVVGISWIAPLFLSIQRSKHEVEEGRQILKAILDASPIGIFLVRDRTIEWTNGALQRMLDYTEENLEGQSTRLIYPDGREYARVGLELYRQIQSQGTGQLDTRLRRKDGTTFPCYFMVRPLKHEDPSQGYIVALTDLTERRKLEEQIIHSQKMEAVGRLAGGIAHDFNNLLTSVMGYAEMLHLKLEEGSRLKDFALEIKKAGELAGALTRQLLTFSHKEVQQFRLLQIDTVVESLHQMLRRLIGEDIDLTIKLNAPGGLIRMDQGQIEQAIMNLVVNARDAMPDGGRLTIETFLQSLEEAGARHQLLISPGPYVILKVTDSGCGMDSETRAHIFEPFFTTKGKGKGTGLGLATTYAVIHQAGGTVDVLSEPGRGSVFMIYLPRVEAVPSDESPVLQPEGQWLAQGGETILLVEDEASVRGFALRALEENGYTVLEAEDGSKAVEMSQRYLGRIHLLVTDVVMPHMSGLQLAQALSIGRPEMKVLYISGYPEEAITHHGLKERGLTFLRKPFSAAELLQRVRTILEGPTAKHLTVMPGSRQA